MAKAETPPIEDLRMWRALVDLYALLQSGCNEEARYQRFFSAHPVTFSVLGFDRYAAFEKSSGNALPFDSERGYSPEPDFLCANSRSGVLTVFELKTPFVGTVTTSRSDGNRAKFKASAEAYLSQAREYVSSIRGNISARDVVKEVLSIPKISEYQIALIFGLEEDQDAPLVEELLGDRKIPIQILAFDQVLERLAQALGSSRRVAVAPGRTYVYHVAVRTTTTRAYVADCGDIGRNRVSLVREGDVLAFECTDSRGTVHRVEGRCDEGVHYVRFEFSSAPESLFMSLVIDDEEHDLRVRSAPIDCDPNPERFRLGGSMDGSRTASFQLYETYNVNRTMSLDERIVSYLYFREKFGLPLFMDT